MVFQVGVYTYAQYSTSNLIESISHECKQEYSCANCNEVKICPQKHGTWEKEYLVRCHSPTPYCDPVTATCVSIPSSECSPTNSSLICMKDGTFPDPVECGKYHVCKNSTSYSYRCNCGNYENPFEKEKCLCNTKCDPLLCSRKSGQKVAYAHDANTYAYCVNGFLLFVDRCPHGYLFLENQQICQ